jgi:hypothetical protein
MLRKLLQVASVRLAASRPQAFFHSQICNKLPHRPRVPRNLTLSLHSLIILALGPKDAVGNSRVPTLPASTSSLGKKRQKTPISCSNPL